MKKTLSTFDFCELLTSMAGTSGDEENAANEAKEILSEYMNVTTDVLGSVIATANESGNIKVLLDAHIDRIGLIVRGIDENGFLLIDKVGGVDERTLVGAEVEVFAKEKLTGIICSTPPHLLKGGDSEKQVNISSLAIDIGFDKESAEQYVSLGDRAIVHSQGGKLLGDKFTFGALDDRSGAVSVIKAAQAVSDKLHNVALTVLLSAQEETGGSGAKAGAYKIDADYAVAVDVGFGSDKVTNIGGETIDLAKGPSIGISPVLDRELMLRLKSLAEENNIPYQHDVMTPRTGTNADHICISKGGTKTALLSIPLRYMHTPVEVVDVSDIDNTAKLLEKFILSLEEKSNA